MKSPSTLLQEAIGDIITPKMESKGLSLPEMKEKLAKHLSIIKKIDVKKAASMVRQMSDKNIQDQYNKLVEQKLLQEVLNEEGISNGQTPKAFVQGLKDTAEALSMVSEDIPVFILKAERALGGSGLAWKVSPIINSGNFHIILTASTGQTELSKKWTNRNTPKDEIKKSAADLQEKFIRSKAWSRYDQSKSKIEFSGLSINIQLYKTF